MSSSFIATDMARPTRLDRVLRAHYPDWGRQAVQRLITGGQVTVNGRTVWLASWEVRNGDRLVVAEAPAAKPTPFIHLADSWLIAEMEDLIAVNKPAGLLSEATRWGSGVNLLDLATARFGPLVLFHRLDRDTSGVILLTRQGPINQYLDRAFKERTVKKEYLAVVGTPNRLARTGVIDAHLAPNPQRREQMRVVTRGGQRAITLYTVEEEREGRQLVRLWPQTGRTHQLRVHLASMGAAILGDRIYGPRTLVGDRLLLHAYRIDLPPAEGFSARTLIAPLPDDFFWKTRHE